MINLESREKKWTVHEYGEPSPGTGGRHRQTVTYGRNTHVPYVVTRGNKKRAVTAGNKNF